MVQDEPAPTYPEAQLPTDLWTRPIESQNREWSVIAGSWLGLGGGSHGVGSYGPNGPFAPYTQAPETAHIVWVKEIAFGGLAGGELGDVGYYGGSTIQHILPPTFDYERKTIL